MPSNAKKPLLSSNRVQATPAPRRSRSQDISPLPSGRAAVPTVVPLTASQGALWSPAVEAILEQPPANLPLRLTWGGIAFVAIFGYWAWVGQINELGHAKGQLVPQGKAFSLQASNPGKIVSLNVIEGQAVEQGQIVATIENDLAQDEVTRLEQGIEAKQLEISQKQGLKLQSLLMRQNLQTSNQADLQAQEALVAQVQAKKEMLQQLIKQKQRDIDGYRQRRMRLLPLVEAGVIPLEPLFELEQSMREHESRLIESQGSLKQADTEQLQLEAKLKQKRYDAKNNDIEATKQIQVLDMQISELENSILERKSRLKSAKSQLNQYSLYAPVSGTVASLNINNVGEVVQPGKSIAEFHASNAPLILQAILPSQEAGFLEKGMSAKVKFDAYPHQKYGIVEGKVMFISPDAELDPKTGTAYRLEIQLEQSTIQDQDRDIALKAGQTATADIIVRQRRIADVILEPIKGLKNEIVTFEEKPNLGRFRFWEGIFPEFRRHHTAQ